MAETPPPPPPPAIERPAPYQVSYGLIEGTAAPGTERVVVRVDGRVVATLRNTGRRFRVDVDLPMREVAIRVETVDDRGRRVGRTVRPVLGLPRSARPRIRIPHLDSSLQGDVRRVVSRFDGIAGVYVENLTSGGAAAWNARATFPAASTLKVGIAVALLSRTDGPPAFGTSTDRVLRGMLISSDNIAANRALLLIAGSTSGGGRVVTAQLRSIGLERTEMYGGYIVGTSLEPTRDVAARGVPITVVAQPYWGVGKATTAADLARLHRAVWLASAGLGPLSRSRSGLDPAEARYILYLLAKAQPRSKLARVTHGRQDLVVLHKAGWVDAARHDAGLVVWRGGIFVAAVMTYRGAGAGKRSDVLAGHVANDALRRFRG